MDVQQADLTWTCELQTPAWQTVTLFNQVLKSELELRRPKEKVIWGKGAVIYLRHKIKQIK